MANKLFVIEYGFRINNMKSKSRELHVIDESEASNLEDDYFQAATDEAFAYSRLFPEFGIDEEGNYDEELYTEELQLYLGEICHSVATPFDIQEHGKFFTPTEIEDAEIEAYGKPTRKVYFLSYGCYLGVTTIAIVSDSHEEAEKEAYHLAVGSTEDWVGSHGFCAEIEEMEEEGCSQEEIDEYVRSQVEDHVEYYAELFNIDPEGEHAINMYGKDFENGVRLYEELHKA